MGWTRLGEFFVIRVLQLYSLVDRETSNSV